MKRLAKVMLMTSAIAAAPIAVAAQDWSGAYGGLTLGYVDHRAGHTFSNGAPSGNSDPTGALYGGFLGYALQSGQTVYGAEIDIEGNTASGSYTQTTGATSGGSADGKWQGSVRGVLGFAGTLGGNPALYYATAGWAHGEFDLQGGPSGGFVGNGYSQSMDGWTVGIGMDSSLGGNLSLRTEYRYTDFGSANGTLAPGFPGVTMPVSVEQHAFRVGLRMNF